MRSFKGVQNDFRNVMEMYLKFIPLVLSAGPLIVSEVDPDYFRSAVRIIFEIGAKLCYVFWRKFDKEN